MKEHKGCFRGDGGKLYVVRCPSCGRENWAPAVATGECAWCGWTEKEVSKSMAKRIKIQKGE